MIKIAIKIQKYKSRNSCYWFYIFKNCVFSFLLFIYTNPAHAQFPEGFSATGNFDEQEISVTDTSGKVSILINAPTNLDHKRKTFLIFYALPNGNTIEWTK